MGIPESGGCHPGVSNSRSQAGDEGQLGLKRGRHPRHYGKMMGIQKEKGGERKGRGMWSALAETVSRE